MLQTCDIPVTKKEKKCREIMYAIQYKLTIIIVAIIMRL